MGVVNRMIYFQFNSKETTLREMAKQVDTELANLVLTAHAMAIREMCDSFIEPEMQWTARPDAVTPDLTLPTGYKVHQPLRDAITNNQPCNRQLQTHRIPNRWIYRMSLLQSWVGQPNSSFPRTTQFIKEFKFSMKSGNFPKYEQHEDCNFHRKLTAGNVFIHR